MMRAINSPLSIFYRRQDAFECVSEHETWIRRISGQHIHQPLLQFVHSDHYSIDLRPPLYITNSLILMVYEIVSGRNREVQTCMFSLDGACGLSLLHNDARLSNRRMFSTPSRYHSRLSNRNPALYRGVSSNVELTLRRCEVCVSVSRLQPSIPLTNG